MVRVATNTVLKEVGNQEYVGFAQNAPVNIIYCDTDFNITYANPRSIKTLETIEDHLPISTDEIVGSNIDIFHKNPKVQRKILKNPKNYPIHSLIEVGPEKLDLLVAAVFDEDENLIGSMLTWEVITKKLETDANLARTESMMRNAPVNVMFADRDFNITYLNPKSLETLKTVEAYLPVKADEIIGQSIDIFHKKPEYQRGILKDDKQLPRRAIIDVGPEKLDLLVSPIYGNENEYLGAMVTWDVVTKKLATEESMTRITNMMENAPTNVIYADLDFNISYVNPKSLETLKTVESYLPITVDQVLHSSIDVFHKNPAHQRNLLANSKNLPFQGIIDVGPEKLDLLVTEIRNQNNENIGYMLTWDVVTEKLRQEAEVTKISNMMESAPNNVIYCDLDLNISYMNPASRSTLETVQQYLPVNVDDIIGSSIDIFHKNPSHQRQLLSNERNFPFQSVIDVGPEKLDLLVSVIRDANQQSIGYMLTWEVITEKLQTEQEMTRVTNMMQNAPVNVLYCNRDYNIVYANPKSTETLKTIEQYLPIAVNDIVGSSMDIFHKNPMHQRNLLNNDKNLPFQTIIDVGPEKLDLLVVAIYDSNNEYIGNMLTWDIVTKKIAADEEMAKIKNMMDCAPVNIIFANKDLNIDYINPMSLNTLRTLEHLLPRKADAIMGESIDIFHKNPSHQRRILENDRNLPHNAKIKLGEDTLDLLVSPIYDHNQKYLGPMLTWTIISDKVALVDNLGKASEQLAASSEQLNAIASQIASNSEETTSQASTATSAAENVAKGVEVVATSTEEMNASIKEIATSANEASTMSSSTKTEADETNRIISQLGVSSQEIGNVIDVINSIAQQTNLLALNATIEAARAGDAGRGFAVVANEVKELAKQTASATEEITKKIGTIQTDTSEAVDAIKGIGDSIAKLNDIAGAIAASVDEQLATTTEVARVVQETNDGVKGIATNIGSVSTAAADTSKGASDLVEAARALGEMAANMKDLVSKIEI